MMITLKIRKWFLVSSGYKCQERFIFYQCEIELYIYLVNGSLKVCLIVGDLYINAKERFVLLVKQSPSASHSYSQSDCRSRL